LLIAFVLLAVLFLNVSVLNTQIGAFTDRFTSANEQEGGLNGVLIDRFLGGLVGAFKNIDDAHAIFGQGIGMGTNVGAQLLSGKTTFLIDEQEWGRIIGESGMVLGLLIILIRISMAFSIGIRCYAFLKKGDALPWMLLSFGFLTLLQSQWAQPTILGFYVLIGGLILASLKKPIDLRINEARLK